jgi:tRNA(Ile)-lysidine synthase
LKVRKIVLGHHRDDSVETALLGFLKGAGLKGISGLEKVAVRNGFWLIRPLLDFSKEEIAAYLSERGLWPCLDSSNLTEKYLRNRLRLKVLPFLRKNINPKVEGAILRLSEIYSRENEYLEELVSRNIRKVVREKQGRFYINRKNFLKFHPALGRRFLRRIFDRLGIMGEGSNFRQIEIIRNFISSSRCGQGLDLAAGYTVRAGRDEIVIEKKIIKRRGKDITAKGINTLYPLNIPGETIVKDLNIKIAARVTKRHPSLKEMKMSFPAKVFFDMARIKMPLYLRVRKPGDRFRPLGMAGTAKLKKYFINAKIPQEERGRIPLLVSGGEIIGVIGQAISETVKVRPETKDILLLRQIPLT